MAGCWEILHALHIGDKEVVVGENLTAPNEARYMCAYCTANDIMRGYNECMASGDYLEIMELYTERITGQIEAVKAEIAERQLPDMTISADQCHKNDFSKSIVGKIVAIRADALRREYRSADHQLVLVNGGFGAAANARGSAVYATNLYSGKESRYAGYGAVKTGYPSKRHHDKRSILKRSDRRYGTGMFHQQYAASAGHCA